ncbi:MOSC domain-containing protein [Hydrogenophaga sp. PAMC20947]|uniref:MOSC domain-containing protein n=1 Tax=Hydrogenophaga sp. PAMC20947 TaxID=2565558 RepID=UPI00109E25C8|nr:MOSC domain-containing protein [Hydrogenophaga sp. PAMC20947]QCB47869.1 MOSC domain-containing protein [Hydrogenophaga sp. PAMC20947]
MPLSASPPPNEPAQGLRDLTAQFPFPGRLEAIWVRTQRRGQMQRLDTAQAEVGRGLLGDHRASRFREDQAQRSREITLIQAEHLPLVAQWTGLETVEAGLLRRNLVISGINLLGLRSPFPDARLVWQLGDEVLLQITGPCDPCSRMEALLGPGGYNAMRGHGGLTAMLLRGGCIRVGDTLHPFAGPKPQAETPGSGT